MEENSNAKLQGILQNGSSGSQASTSGHDELQTGPSTSVRSAASSSGITTSLDEKDSISDSEFEDRECENESDSENEEASCPNEELNTSQMLVLGLTTSLKSNDKKSSVKTDDKSTNNGKDSKPKKTQGDRGREKITKYPKRPRRKSGEIQPPQFLTGLGANSKKGKVVNKVKFERKQQNFKPESSTKVADEILQIHVDQMHTLYDKIVQLQSSRNDKLVEQDENDHDYQKDLGTLEALFSQFQEMQEQFNVFTNVRERAQNTLKDQQLKSQLQREIFRLKNRLPAFAKREQIDKLVENFSEKESNPDSSSRFIIIQGQTGSGKSTQIPQYLADHPKLRGKQIVCTQPRKIAAINLAKRVAYEYSGGSEKARPGADVGYHVGSQKVGGPKCSIEFITEGVMLERIMTGTKKPFENVGCIIIDEAHERSIYCDILLGSFKKEDIRWKDILIVVTSATIDIQEFSQFFNSAPIVEIPGKMFPIEKFYHPLPSGDDLQIQSIRRKVVELALDIHISVGTHRGDILCFLPGQEDVLNAKDDFERELESYLMSSKRNGNILQAKVYSLYGRQDPIQQQQVFEELPKTIRKVIFATNVAETSITIDGVIYVVDSGVTKEMAYDPRRNISTLKLNSISKSSATQRAGRSGRTRPGQSHCIYSESDYLNMSPISAPEVFRRPLSLAVLSLIEMDLDPRDFEWISAPPKEAILAAEEELRYLGAIDEENNKSTELGKMISQCQQEPKLVRVIFHACQKGMGFAAITAAAILTVSNMFFYSGNDDASRKESRAKRNAVAHKDGDVVTMYRVFQKYLAILEGKEEDEAKEKGQGDFAQQRRRKAGEWCRNNFVNGKALGLIQTAKKDLLRVFKPSPIWKQQETQKNEPSDEDLRRLIFSGYFLHIARLIHTSTRKSRSHQYFAIHPGVVGALDYKCAILNVNEGEQNPPEWIVYEKVLRLTTTLLPTSTHIDHNWLKEESPSFYALCAQKLSTLPTEKIVIATSQECLRTIVGKYFVNINSLEEELDAGLDVDIENGILAVFCSPSKKAWVEATIKKKVSDVMKVLGAQVIEEEYLGGTRLVVGLGYEIQQVLFPQEYVTLFIRNIQKFVAKTDLEEFFEQIQILDKIRSLLVNEYETNKTALIKFYSKTDAKVALELLSTVSFLGVKLDVIPTGLGPKKGVSQEEVCRLKLSWPLGPSDGKAQICFHSALDANRFVENISNTFPSSRISGVHGDMLHLGVRKPRKGPNNGKPQPSVIALPKGVKGCRYRFSTDFPDDQNNDLDYKVTVVDLPGPVDEQELLLRMKPTIPKWVRINRKISQETAEAASSGTLMTEELKNEKLEPLKPYFSDSTFKTHFYFDKNLGRAIFYIMFDDKVTIQKALRRSDYSTLSNQFGQIHRLEMEYNHTTSVNMELFQHFHKEITDIKDTSFKRGSLVSQIMPKTGSGKNFNRNNSKTQFVILKFRSCNSKLIREVQQNLENISACTKYNHDKAHLLFTNAGLAQLQRLSETMFIHVNPRNCGLYIYGSEEVQEKARKKLRLTIEKLEEIDIFDRPVMLNKRKVNFHLEKDRRKIERMCIASKLKHFELLGSRVLVSGTQEVVSAFQKVLEDADLLFKPPPSKFAKLFGRGRPECQICLSTAEPGTFIQSSVCPHAFCIECIQPMFRLRPPPFPVKCLAENCNQLLAINDIIKGAQKEGLRKFLEVAVSKYQEENDGAFFCPKPDCGQLLSAGDKIAGEYGGEFYFCDECVSTYCIPCSQKAEKPVKSHEFDSCEDTLNGGPSDEVRHHVKQIQETIFNLSCPRCKAAFLDFNGCAAVICESCNCGFCGICLKDCGTDAHAHVSQCSANPSNSYFISELDLSKIHRKMRIQKLKDYLQTQVTDGEVLCSIFRTIRRDMMDLSIEEDEIKPYIKIQAGGETEERQQRRYIEHILEQILTFQCPICKKPILEEFDECAALKCNSCGAAFCGVCFKDCGADAHDHVWQCEKNPDKAVFVMPETLKRAHKQIRVDKLTEYLKNEVSQDQQRKVLEAVRASLVAHGIDCNSILI